MSATDGDAGSFGTLTYSTDMDEYFTIDNNGQITVQKTPNGNPIGYSTSVAFNTSVTDGGGLSTTASVTVVISGIWGSLRNLTQSYHGTCYAFK